MIILRKNIVARCVEFYCKRPTDLLAVFVYLGYVIVRGLRMFTRLQQILQRLTFCHRIGI